MEFNMFKKIAKFFMPYQKVEVTSNLKMVEEPVKEEVIQSAEVIKGPVKCGCGRSPTGECVGLHALGQEEWNSHTMNPNKVTMEEPKIEVTTGYLQIVEEPKVEPKPRKPRAKKTAPAKTAAKTTKKTK
jgi:hypothetical protein